MNEMPLKFDCRHCGEPLTASLSEANRTILCPKCHSQALVPAAAAEREDDEYPLCDGVDQPPAHVNAAHQQYIAVVCTLCETRIHATVDQVGQQIQCPDCGRSQIVPQPPKPVISSAPLLAADYKEGYAVRDEPDQPVHAKGIEEDAIELRCSVCRAALPLGGSKPGDRLFCRFCGGMTVVPVKGEEQGSDARAAAQPPADWQAPPPIRMLWPGVLQFPLYPGCRSRLLALSVSGAVMMVGLAISSALVGEVAGAMLGVCLYVLSFLLGLGWCVVLAASSLAILGDTSEGVDIVESWPDGMWIDWAPTSLFVFNNLALSVVPGFLISLFPISANMVRLVLAASVFFLFPIIVLSMQEAASVLQFYSYPILRSLRRAWWAWGLFYVASAAVTFAAAVLIVVASIIPFVGILICIGVLLYATMIYFRLMGRLTWFIERA